MARDTAFGLENRRTRRLLRWKALFHHPLSSDKRKRYRQHRNEKLNDSSESRLRRKVKYWALFRHPLNSKKRRKYRQKHYAALDRGFGPKFERLETPPRKAYSKRPVNISPSLWFYLGDSVDWLNVHTRLTGVGRVSVEILDAILQEPGLKLKPCRTGSTDLDLVGMSRSELDQTLLKKLDARYSAGSESFSGGEVPSPGDHVFFTGLVWTPKFTSLFQHLSSKGIGFSVLVHDIIPLENRDFVGRQEASEFAEWLMVALQTADRIFVSTTVVRDQILRWAVLEGIEVAAELVILPFGSRPWHDNAVSQTGGLEDRLEGLAVDNFVLSVGTIDPRKNQILLCQVWRRLVEEGYTVPQLVLAGRDDAGLGSKRSLYYDLVRSGKLLVLPGLSDDEIDELTVACRFTAFPSTSEGYGLPVAESLQRGKLCLAARLPVIEEQAGSFAWYFDLEKFEDVVDLFRHAIQNPDNVIAANEKIKVEYVRPDWSVAASLLVEAGKEAAQSEPRSIIQGRFRPEIPGAADFETAAVLNKAAKWCSADAPSVSILIVNWNAAPLTLECIRQVWKNTTEYRYEIIIVDNGSGEDDIERFSAPIPGVTFIEIGKNRFFGEANNIAAEVARGDYIVLLNNDAFPQAGWLPAMLKTMNDTPSLGGVGPMYLWPDGRVQEAGGMIDEGGYPVRFGRGLKTPTPDLLVEKYIDYTSAAALLIDRALFIKVGGFDLTFEPAYYEDTDLYFKFKALGQPIAYCPKARVIHIEGAAASGNSKAELRRKALGDCNRDKFVSRWKSFLTQSDSGEPEFDFNSFIPAVWSKPVDDDAQRPRAAVFTPYSVTPGGGERYILSAARQLARTHQVEVVTPHLYSNLRLQQIGCALDLDLGMLKFKTLAEFEKDEDPDLMLTMGNAVLPTIAGRGRKSIYHCQFPFVTKEDDASDDAMLRSYQKVMVNSGFTRGFYENRLAKAGFDPMPTVIVSPPVPLVEPRSSRKRAILSVGRFILGGHSKRQDLQVEAFRKIVEAGVDDVELHLAGSSFPEAADIDFLASIRKAAIDLPVFFHINCSAQELKTLYGESLIYWHATGLGRDLEQEPEKAEHFGISVVEAMSGGAIPVTLRAGGPTEIITEGVNGFFYDDLDGLVRQTMRLLSDADPSSLKQLSLAAQARAKDFGYDQFNASIASLFDQPFVPEGQRHF